MGICKTREEYDREDQERHFKKLQFQREKREEKRAKFEAEGYKCKIEGCGQSFKDKEEYQAHHKEHMDQMYKDMICNQPKCGMKFQNRKQYKEHVESHKQEARRKILNSIR